MLFGPLHVLALEVGILLTSNLNVSQYFQSLERHYQTYLYNCCISVLIIYNKLDTSCSKCLECLVLYYVIFHGCFDHIYNYLQLNLHVTLAQLYSEELSHMLYAAADMVLVPSMYEPCGLAQMIGMRYGAVCTSIEKHVHDFIVSKVQKTVSEFKGLDKYVCISKVSVALS